MRTLRKLTVAATAVTMLGLPTLTSAATSDASSPTDCLHIQQGTDSYIATFTPAPKKKKDPPATLISATGYIGFQIGNDPSQTTTTASCLGATYTLHVKNYDSTTKSDSSTSLDYQGFTATPNTGTATLVDPSEVDISWNGDGSTTAYSATVTTGPNDPSNCIDVWVTTAVAGVQQAKTNTAPTCYGSGGGNTFLG